MRVKGDNILTIAMGGGRMNFSKSYPAVGGGGGCTAVKSDQLQIGAGTSNSSSAPFYGLYDYSWYGGIWLASEFTGTADGQIQITGLEVERGSVTAGYPTNNMQIWISEITEEIFDSAPAVDGADLTKSNEVKVFDGNLTWNSGWNEVTFDTNYCYGGSNNLLVEWRNYDGSWQSGYGHGEYDFSPAVSRAAYKATDDAYPTGDGIRNNSRINTIFKY